MDTPCGREGSNGSNGSKGSEGKVDGPEGPEVCGRLRRRVVQKGCVERFVRFLCLTVPLARGLWRQLRHSV